MPPSTLPLPRLSLLLARRPYATAFAPFSTPLTPAPPKPTGKAEEAAIRSGTPAGTQLKHINYLKGKQDPVALEDHEYPDWLWKALDGERKTAGSAGGEDEGDLYSKSKKARRVATKRAAKIAANAPENPEIRVPIDEQTLDLPFATISPDSPHPSSIRRLVSAVGGVGQNLKSELPVGARAGAKRTKSSTVEIGGDVQVTAEEAQRARDEVKKERRRKGRAAIKEKNFLSGM